MFNMSLRYVFSKKSTVFIVLFISVSYVLLSGMTSIYDSMIADTFYEEERYYGRFHAILFDVTDEMADEYRNNLLVTDVGITENLGLYLIDGTDFYASIGTMDDISKKLLPIELLEGRWATGAGEIVVTEDMKYYYETKETELGDDISFIKDGKTESYRITGFISSYTSHLEGSDYLIRGHNDFPMAIKASSEGTTEKTRIMTVRLHETSGRMISPDKNIQLLWNRIVKPKALDHDVEMKFNDGLFNFSYNEEIRPLTIHKTIDYITALISLAVLIFVILQNYTNDLRSVARTCYMLGSDKRSVTYIYVFVVLILTAEGFLLGMIGGSFLFGTLNRTVFSETEIVFDMMKGMILIVIVFFASVIVFFTGRFYDETMFFSSSREKVGRDGSVGVLSMLLSNIRMNFLKMVCVFISLILFTVTVLSFSDEVKDRRSLLRLNEDPWYSAVSKAQTVVTQYGAFEVEPSEVRFPMNKIKKLENTEGVDHIDKGFGGLSIAVIFSEDDGRYADYCISTNWNEETDSVIRTGFPYNLKALNNYSLVVLNERSFREVFELNGIIRDTNLKKGECIVFFPDFHEGGEYEYDILEHYDRGSGLMLGRLRLKSGETDIFSIDKLELVTENLVIEDVLSQKYRSADKSTGQVYEDGLVTILISEECFMDSDLFEGVSSFSMILENDISDEDRNSVLKRYYALAASSACGSTRNYYDVKRHQDSIERVVRRSIVILAVLIGLCALISTATVISQSIAANRREFGIMRSIGMTKAELFSILTLEHIFYFMLFVVAGSILSFIYMKEYSLRVTGILMQMSDIGAIVVRTVLIGLGYLVISMICVFIYTLRYFRDSISSIIRFSE